MSLRCQILDCSSWVEYECSCDKRLQLCEFHFSKHREVSGCQGASITNELSFRVFKLKQAYSLLKEVKKDSISVINQMISNLEFLLTSLLRNLKSKQKALKKMLTEGLEGEIDEILGQYRYTSFKNKKIDNFIKLTKDFLDSHFSADPGEERKYKEISFEDEVILRFGSHSDVQDQFSRLNLKEKIKFVERVGITLKDVSVDTYEVKISNDTEHVAICIQ